VDARRSATALAREALEKPLAEHALDAIVTISSGPAWLTDYVLGDHYTISTTSPAAVAGCPAITVPAGSVSGLPVGVTFMGPRWSEPRLLNLAYAFEQSLQAARPRLLPPLVTP
jgi:amidase